MEEENYKSATRCDLNIAFVEKVLKKINKMTKFIKDLEPSPEKAGILNFDIKDVRTRITNMLENYISKLDSSISESKNKLKSYWYTLLKNSSEVFDQLNKTVFPEEAELYTSELIKEYYDCMNKLNA